MSNIFYQLAYLLHRLASFVEEFGVRFEKPRKPVTYYERS